MLAAYRAGRAGVPWTGSGKFSDKTTPGVRAWGEKVSGSAGRVKGMNPVVVSRGGAACR